MQSRDELQEFYSSDQIDEIKKQERKDDRKSLRIMFGICSFPIIIGLLGGGITLIKNKQIKDKYNNASTITQTFEENEHTVFVPVNIDDKEISDIEMHDGYEPISIGDGKIIYTNTEPVEVDGLLFEDGTSEFNEFGTVIENKKSK